MSKRRLACFPSPPPPSFPFMTFPGHKTFGIPHSGKKSGRRKKPKKDFRFPTVTRCPTSAYLVVPPFLRQDGGETESKLSISLLVKGATPPPKQTNKNVRNLEVSCSSL